MKSRRMVVPPVALGALMLASGCAAPTAGSKPADTKAYLGMLRKAATPPNAHDGYFRKFTPQQNSDEKLISVGEEVCTLLRGHGPDDVVSLLESEGWNAPAAIMIVMDASMPDEFCPDQCHTVNAWVKQKTGI